MNKKNITSQNIRKAKAKANPENFRERKIKGFMIIRNYYLK